MAELIVIVPDSRRGKKAAVLCDRYCLSVCPSVSKITKELLKDRFRSHFTGPYTFVLELMIRFWVPIYGREQILDSCVQ